MNSGSQGVKLRFVGINGLLMLNRIFAGFAEQFDLIGIYYECLFKPFGRRNQRGQPKRSHLYLVK